jgi:hypothetical protein
MVYKSWYGFGLFALCMAITIIFSYSISGNWDARYMQMFHAQAEAFLQGRVDLPVTWTHDLIPFNDKLFLALPPLNGFLITPFVYLFGDKFTETIFALILYAFLIVIQFIYVEKFAADKDIWQRSLLFVFLALGTMLLPCAVISTSWFNAVLSSCIFLSLAWLTLYYAETLKQDVLAISFLALASMSRFHLALILPVFIIKAWMTRYKGKLNALIALSVPAAIFIVFVLWWNWVRFGNPFSLNYDDHAYAAFFQETIQKHGFHNLVYIFPNIYHGIIAFPELITQFPFFKIDEVGNGILAISPLFIYILVSKHQDKPWYNFASWHNFAWLCIAIIAIPVFTHFSTGWRQFGYRYFLDFFPFVAFLLLQSKVKSTSPLSLFCIALSIWFNIFGTIMLLNPKQFGV